MKKLSALLGVKELSGAHVGIEIEAEGEGMTLVVSPNWRVKTTNPSVVDSPISVTNSLVRCSRRIRLKVLLMS